MSVSPPVGRRRGRFRFCYHERSYSGRSASPLFVNMLSLLLGEYPGVTGSLGSRRLIRIRYGLTRPKRCITVHSCQFLCPRAHGHLVSPDLSMVASLKGDQLWFEFAHPWRVTILRMTSGACHSLQHPLVKCAADCSSATCKISPFTSPGPCLRHILRSSMWRSCTLKNSHS